MSSGTLYFRHAHLRNLRRPYHLRSFNILHSPCNYTTPQLIFSSKYGRNNISFRNEDPDSVTAKFSGFYFSVFNCAIAQSRSISLHASCIIPGKSSAMSSDAVSNISSVNNNNTRLFQQGYNIPKDGMICPSTSSSSSKYINNGPITGNNTSMNDHIGNAADAYRTISNLEAQLLHGALRSNIKNVNSARGSDLKATTREEDRKRAQDGSGFNFNSSFATECSSEKKKAGNKKQASTTKNTSTKNNINMSSRNIINRRDEISKLPSTSNLNCSFTSCDSASYFPYDSPNKYEDEDLLSAEGNQVGSTQKIQGPNYQNHVKTDTNSSPLPNNLLMSNSASRSSKKLDAAGHSSTSYTDDSHDHKFNTRGSGSSEDESLIKFSNNAVYLRSLLKSQTPSHEHFKTMSNIMNINRSTNATKNQFKSTNIKSRVLNFTNNPLLHNCSTHRVAAALYVVAGKVARLQGKHDGEESSQVCGVSSPSSQVPESCLLPSEEFFFRNWQKSAMECMDEFTWKDLVSIIESLDAVKDQYIPSAEFMSQWDSAALEKTPVSKMNPRTVVQLTSFATKKKFLGDHCHDIITVIKAFSSLNYTSCSSSTVINHSAWKNQIFVLKRDLQQQIDSIDAASANASGLLLDGDNNILAAEEQNDGNDVGRKGSCSRGYPQKPKTAKSGVLRNKSTTARSIYGEKLYFTRRKENILRENILQRF